MFTIAFWFCLAEGVGPPFWMCSCRTDIWFPAVISETGFCVMSELLVASSGDLTVWPTGFFLALIAPAFNFAAFLSKRFSSSVLPPSGARISLLQPVTAFRFPPDWQSSVSLAMTRSKSFISRRKFYYESLWFISLKTCRKSVNSANSSPLNPR